MNMTRSAIQIGLTAILTALLPGIASAHSLVFACKAEAADTIRCKGEFSDGSDAIGMKYSVLSYDDVALHSGSLGADSSASFKRPAGKFYVRLDDGGEHSAEVDHADIE